MTTELDDSRRLARATGLQYVTDSMPGLQRRRCGRGFVYLSPRGKRVTNRRTLERIRALAIPPAYRNVWICPWENGHLQATGFDEAGRKQYRYHPRWRERRSLRNFDRLVDFAERLPLLRRRVSQDLKGRDLTHDLVAACVVRLLDETLIRVGNEEYYKANGSHGLTTLRSRHLTLQRRSARLRFLGKSGITHTVHFGGSRLLHVIRRCHELPGQHLFQYETSDGGTAKVSSTDVNAYLVETMGEGVSAKDFRTWGGTVLAAILLAEEQRRSEEESRPPRLGDAIKQVAERLGNRPVTCRKYYIHPKVIEVFENGSLLRAMNASPRLERPVPWTTLSAEEQSVLDLLRS
jgi:DNA topoisomerase-1